MIDLHEIIASTRDYNFHSHTQFCDGRETMAAMVQQAISCGMKHYGFSPHSPIPLPSPCNMSALSVDEYIAKFNRLKELYDGRINLYLSMEIDFLGDKWGASDPYFDTVPLDYRLSSVHFISSPDGTEVDVDGRPGQFKGKMETYFDNDIRYVVDSFYERTLQMIEKGGFHMLGHFDKIGFNASSFSPGIEDEPWYRRHIDDVIDAVRDTDIIVEINTKAYPAPVGASAEEVAGYVSRLFPSPNVIRRLVTAGIPLAVNSDAHYSSRITAGRDEAFAIIDGK